MAELHVGHVLVDEPAFDRYRRGTDRGDSFSGLRRWRQQGCAERCHHRRELEVRKRLETDAESVPVLGRVARGLVYYSNDLVVERSLSATR